MGSSAADGTNDNRGKGTDHVINVMFFSAPQWLQNMMLGVAQAQGDQLPATDPAEVPSMMPVFVGFGVITLLFYLLILKPQKTERKKQEDMIGSMAKGDEVVTIGGIHGKIESIDTNKNVLSIGIGPKSSIKIDRWAVKSVIPKGKKKKEADA